MLLFFGILFLFLLCVSEAFPLLTKSPLHLKIKNHIIVGKVFIKYPMNSLYYGECELAKSGKIKLCLILYSFIVTVMNMYLSLRNFTYLHSSHIFLTFLYYVTLSFILSFYNVCNEFSGLGLMDCHISCNTNFACILSGTLDKTFFIITYKIKLKLIT